MVRWYVLQVSTGQETGVRDALQGLGIRAAVPREERAIRNGGGWTTKVYTLLPGYVFLGAGVQCGELLPGEGDPPCTPLPRPQRGCPPPI